MSVFTIKFLILYPIESGELKYADASKIIISNLKTSSIGNFNMAANSLLEKAQIL